MTTLVSDARIVLAFAFVLGVLVFVHELGHFLAAKRVGIRVLKFQLGFNPTIISFRRGDTEYGIGALPLGGFVKMAGETPEDVPTGRSDEFLSKTKWERFQVLIMGPVMNILLAFALTALVLYQGYEKEVYEDQPVTVGAVEADTPAAKANIQPGDRIVSANGHRVDTWEQFYIAVGSRPNRATTLGVLHNGVEDVKTVTPATAKGSRLEVGEIGVFPDTHPHLAAVTPGDPGARAGLKDGDVIVAVDGKPISFHTQLRELIGNHPKQPMAVTVQRGGATQTLTVTPDESGGKGWLGVRPVDDTTTLKPGVMQAMQLAVQKNVEYAGIIFQTLWGLFTGETSPRQLMGPVAIAQLSGESAELGWLALFTLMASISLNLGLLNLLPIPVLDGGHILIMGLEGIARRDFSIKVKEKMLLAGFVLILMLMVTVIYNDLTRISWIEHLMPWR